MYVFAGSGGDDNTWVNRLWSFIRSPNSTTRNGAVPGEARRGLSSASGGGDDAAGAGSGSGGGETGGETAGGGIMVSSGHPSSHPQVLTVPLPRRPLMPGGAAQVESS
jgi:hypothetical protein